MKKFFSLLLSALLLVGPIQPAFASGLDSFCKLLLHGDGADASTTFTDSSSAAHATTSVDGNAQIDTAQSKFGGASMLFDGSGDSLTYNDHADWDLPGDFTIDFWIRFNSLGIGHGIVNRNDGGANGWQICWSSAAGGQIFLQAGSATFNFSRAWGPSTATWYHVEFDRSGSTNYMFIDGVQQGATYSNSLDMSYTSSMVVAVGDGGRYLDGWLEEFRISIGVARHTAGFTPPTAAYSPDTFIKTVNGLAVASDKTENGLAIASRKTRNGLS